MNVTVMKGVETFLIGLGVVVTSAVIQGLSNYHPTGSEGTIWGIVGVAVIGGLRALLSWFIIKQATPPTLPPIVPPLSTTTKAS